MEEARQLLIEAQQALNQGIEGIGQLQAERDALKRRCNQYKEDVRELHASIDKMLNLRSKDLTEVIATLYTLANETGYFERKEAAAKKGAKL